MKQISPTKARQGFKGRRILSVLIVSLVLVMIVWAAVGIYGKSRPGRGFMDDDQRPPAAPESQTPPSATGRQ